MKNQKKFIRTCKYLYYKLLRVKGTPHSIGISVAIGIFTAFAIPDFVLWGKTIASVSFALKLKANPAIAYAVTWISNPFTDLIIYPTFCYIGSRLLGYNLTLEYIKNTIINLVHNCSWSQFWQLGSQLAISFIVGGILFGIIGAGIGYLIVSEIIKKKRIVAV